MLQSMAEVVDIEQTICQVERTIAMVRNYTAIFKADPATGFTSSYKYLNHYQLLNTTTLESLEEVARKYFHLVGGDLHFFKLMKPIEVPSTRDIQAKCGPLLDYFLLGDASSICATLQELDFEPTEADWKMLVSLVIVCKLFSAYYKNYFSHDVESGTPPLDHTSVSGRSLTVIAEHPDARETIARKAQGKPPPLTGAKSTELLSTQDTHHLDAAYNHRPPELIPPPLSIYDPVFAKFRHEMVTPTETLLFTEDEFDRASRFIDASLRHYPNERARQQALEAVPILDGHYWQTKKILTNASTVEPDGGSCVRSKIGSEFGPVACSSIAELKNGGGDGGCDPSDQAQCGYIKIVSSLQYQPIRLVSCCPAFLVGLSGHTLAIWGAVFADRFFFERLSLMYVGPQAPTTLPSPFGGRSDMEVGIREIAKLLRTLNTCIEDLNAHYTSLTPLPTTMTTSTLNRPSIRPMHGIGIAPSPLATPPYDSFDPSRFVHWKSFGIKGTKYNLEYSQRLTNWMEKTVFRATMTTDTNSEKVDVVVKFAYRYGAAGHRLLAKAGFAPRLYHCAFDETIGMWVVVMDYVSGRVCHGKLIEGERLSIKTAIGLLHAEDLVFGDLREPNVIITEPKNSVCLVDFEWCGSCRDIQEGGNVIPRVRYPTNISMNHEIGWAEGVGRDLVIEKEHNIHRLTRIWAESDSHEISVVVPGAGTGTVSVMTSSKRGSERSAHQKQHRGDSGEARRGGCGGEGRGGRGGSEWSEESIGRTQEAQASERTELEQATIMSYPDQRSYPGSITGRSLTNWNTSRYSVTALSSMAAENDVEVEDDMERAQKRLRDLKRENFSPIQEELCS
ncbi:hypothetical protein D9757_009624 [Collybiopsis confluens]|uniref:Protein kinase domain-containing protein n=1 Tax=Collybiopsis confluens TaxID=2823264 RepID=A0A8H5LWU8_9AGAR|nr:hypothetical protein D9757_009624 [Collybiopsis confluens]